MDPFYRGVYEQLYANFLTGLPRDPEGLRAFRYYGGQEREESSDEQGRAAVAAAIEDADRLIRPSELRSDAKALLAWNFYGFVLVPLRAGGRVDEQEIEGDIKADVVMVVRAASENAAEPEVSAHNVLDALTANWEKLRTGRYRLWQQT